MSCRKNQASLSAAERAAVVAALLALKAAPSIAGTASRYDDFVQEHVSSMTGGNAWAHRRPAFLPWHREFLRRFELALREHEPAVVLPYWDWTVDNLPGSSIWNPDFMGGNGAGPNAEVATGSFAHSTGNWDLTVGGGQPFLRREFGLDVPDLPTATQVSNCLLETPYDEDPWSESGTLESFRNRLEGWFGLGSIHNRVHRWVGGSMQPASSPNDPVFWLHHCNIDRLWAQWQREHTTEPYHPQGTPGDTGPVGHNLNDSMQPWGGGTTVASMLNHHALGYWYDTDPPDVQLTTPSLSFTDVPEGLGGAGRTTYRAIVFEVRSCSPVTLEIIAGPSGGFATTLLGTSVVVPAAHGNAPSIGRLWIAYTSTNPGDVASGSVTVAQVGSSTQWIIALAANTIARPRAAVVLSLDRSGSMSTDAGDGTSKHDKLVEAVEVFVDTMLEGDGLGIVGYDDIVDRHLDITDVGPQPPTPGSGRAQAAAILSGTALDPRGLTAIGPSLVEAQDVLNDGQAAAATPYNELAIVVLTDGIENVAPLIAAVLPGITASTYAVGLGLPSGISTVSLDLLARATGKYLLVTGALTADQRFRLSKFFLQILAGISGAQIIVDPTGNLVFGPTHRIPFDVTAADYGIDAILTSPLVQAIDFRLEAPDGSIIDASLLAGTGEFVVRRNVSYFRLPLPFGGPGQTLQAGRWNALLSLDERRVSKLLADDRDRERILHEIRNGSVAYNFLAHAYSTLTMEASCQQSTVRPGEAALVGAALHEYGVPVEKRAEMWVDVLTPNGATRTVMMAETEAGVFEGAIKTVTPGLYSLRVRARGHTLLGTPFTREAALSVVATLGDAPPGDNRESRSDGRIAELVERVLSHAKREILGMDPDDIRKSVAEVMRRNVSPQPRETPLPVRTLVPPAVPVARLVEPPAPLQFPVPEDHEGMPMFGLSPQDQAIEDARRRAIEEGAPGDRQRPQRRPRRRRDTNGDMP